MERGGLMKTFTCDHCGKTEPAKPDGKAPENWKWEVIFHDD
jgi:hypothetical protein